MRSKLLFSALLMLNLQAGADERSAVQLGELDSRSQLLGVSAMLYFDPRDRLPDPRLLTSVFQHLQTLQTDVQQLGQPPELSGPVQAMQQVFGKLEGLPTTRRQEYPLLVQQLLVHQHELREAAGAAYAREQRELPAEAPAALFSEQSRALASFLFDYQLRDYPVTDKEQWLLSAEQLRTLDLDIEERFALLSQRHGEHAEALDKIRQSYQFVRGQLQQAKGRGQGGAEFYLSRAVTDLDELALTVAQSSR
ncbi:hypothetical protein KRX52_07110 [Pseudomonas sp. MAP12]|uniref:Uncharacterized protein n=1 Tax=Geopseudomonas aromaticivorans TaxID=2849492 RepID=A0ABS6MVY4_9GAMM|nr:hypothetical protein [Pseudomonas aromaticivorans]MBV2132574.1 hypothetical protein [Pseudomonas aromaticivorans]